MRSALTRGMPRRSGRNGKASTPRQRESSEPIKERRTKLAEVHNRSQYQVPRKSLLSFFKIPHSLRASTGLKQMVSQLHPVRNYGLSLSFAYSHFLVH